ncbi:MAG TPA: YihY/virulence factor BrkB family protein [Nitrospira sp.]|nr:YihY/virulence factor BrkB family protein [Nitrospira sp.]
MPMLMSFWRLLADLTRSFLRHGCASLAASLAFFSLLSLFPLVFMLLYGVSFIVSHEVIGGQVLLSFLKGFLPTLGERLAVELQRVSELETVRWLVFLSFAWFGTLVFYELDYALNVVFDSTWKRHPLISTTIAVASQGAVALMLVLSYVATQTVNFLTAYAPHLWGLDLIALAAHDVFLTYTLPFTMAFLTVGALYRYVPRRRPQWREAMIGSLTFSLLWVAAKLIFVTYNEYATVYTKLYGSLLEVILLLLWIYYSALLLLLGAVIAHVLQQRSQASAAGNFSPARMVSPSAHAGG